CFHRFATRSAFNLFSPFILDEYLGKDVLFSTYHYLYVPFLFDSADDYIVVPILFYFFCYRGWINRSTFSTCRTNRRFFKSFSYFSSWLWGSDQLVFCHHRISDCLVVYQNTYGQACC